MRKLFFLLTILPLSVFSQTGKACFTMEASGTTKVVPMALVAKQDTAMTLDRRERISGFSATGHVVFQDEYDCYVRIILRDSHDYDYLVYESYPLLSGTKESDFQSMAAETFLLDNIRPQSLIVECRKAELTIDAIAFEQQVLTDKGKLTAEVYSRKEQQTAFIAERLNENLARRNIPWRAGVTSWAKEMYGEKRVEKDVKVPQLYGFEYYKDGVFIMPADLERLLTSPSRTEEETQDPYVSEWDWRNRHGKYWMTTIKDQGDCFSCWAFSALGALEAYINLYYNQLLYYDLSEQELVSCYKGSCSEDNPGGAYGYIKNNGIVTEYCFNYSSGHGHVADCRNKCRSPQEKIYVHEWDSIEGSVLPNDSLKALVIQRPVSIGIDFGHAVVLAGFKKLELGDVLIQDSEDTLIVNSVIQFIGENVWIIKNSRGVDWGVDGYAHLYCPSGAIKAFPLRDSITSMLHPDSDIVCEDVDGDGFYFWGIGPKPASCPSWVPDTPDGEDTDYTIGPINRYGRPVSLEADSLPPLILDSTTDISNLRYLYRHAVIPSSSRITISHDIEMPLSATITVSEEATLIIDGATISNAKIIVEPGGIVEVINGGGIALRPSSVFEVPLGSTLELPCGTFIR